MALDEPQENDLSFIEQGITFVVEKDLFEKTKPICIDFVESTDGSGFQLTSSLPKGDECGGGCC